MKTRSLTRTWRVVSAAAVLVALGLVLAPTAAADPMPVNAPYIHGAPKLPGPITDPGKPVENQTILKVSPDVAQVGKTATVTATGLPANREVTLAWTTANVRWILDPKLDSLDYIGRKVDRIAVSLGKAQTSATGALSMKFKVPLDFGGLHELYAVVDGKQIAKGGFLLERTVRISPASGPIGTPITVRVVGMGFPTYESVGGVLWDNKYTGAISANMTRGVAVFKLRASGTKGDHWIELGGSSHTVPYLNMQQSPVPWTDGFRLKFRVTGDKGAPPNTLEWPVTIKPTLDAKTTVSALGAEATASAELSSTSGEILSKVDLKASGLIPNTPVDIQWTSVVGNRVNCTGQCWNFVNESLGTGTASSLGALTKQITIPDGLGGWHSIQLRQNNQVKAQVPYFVKRSFVKAPKVVKAGQPFTVELKGVGWTQIDNTVAVTYDNAYIGYACGFNSNGYVRIQLFATGEPGTHLIDLYPLLYTQQPAYPYSQLGMVPLLAFNRDAPGLAAGYDLPAYRLAIKVVK